MIMGAVISCHDTSTSTRPGVQDWERRNPLSAGVVLLFEVTREPTVRGYNVRGGRIFMSIRSRFEVDGACKACGPNVCPCVHARDLDLVSYSIPVLYRSR